MARFYPSSGTPHHLLPQAGEEFTLPPYSKQICRGFLNRRSKPSGLLLDGGIDHVGDAERMGAMIPA